MAGHSHWAGIKHKKAVVDARKGKLFSKLAKNLISAARQGGGDPEMNLKLKYAVEKARAAGGRLAQPGGRCDQEVKVILHTVIKTGAHIQQIVARQPEAYEREAFAAAWAAVMARHPALRTAFEWYDSGELDIVLLCLTMLVTWISASASLPLNRRTSRYLAPTSSGPSVITSSRVPGTLSPRIR